MRVLQILLPVVFLPPLLLPACMEYEYAKLEVTDVFYQKPADAVDILLVIDSSGSMRPYQQKLSENFQGFLTYFVADYIDYHIGAVSTDIESSAAGQLVGPVITAETVDAAEAFADLVRVGAQGSANETGLEAARLALTEPLVSSSNAGFLREEANLSIIFVSDEEDASPLPVNEYINRFFAIKGQRSRSVFNASALCVVDFTSCEDITTYGEESERYPDIATQTHGIVGDICADDFAPIVNELSLNMSKMEDTFFLSSLPDLASMRVSVNDVEIPCDAGEWTYQLVEKDGEALPAIVFLPSTMPLANSQIAVRYNQGSGDPADFCGGIGETGAP
jgi:hypothetical protein